MIRRAEAGHLHQLVEMHAYLQPPAPLFSGIFSHVTAREELARLTRARLLRSYSLVCHNDHWVNGKLLYALILSGFSLWC